MDEEHDYIRPPDEPIKQRLIDFYENDEINDGINDDMNDDTNDDMNDELMLAINMSKNDYNNNQENEELMKIIEISEKELLIYEENIINKLKDLERIKRIESLPLFCKKIKSLIFTKEDIIIKTFIETVLDDYFNLKIDSIHINSIDSIGVECLYDKIYNIIDTYYLIPNNKNYKKTSITKEEDEIIRTIFLH